MVDLLYTLLGAVLLPRNLIIGCLCWRRRLVANIVENERLEVGWFVIDTRCSRKSLRTRKLSGNSSGYEWGFPVEILRDLETFVAVVFCITVRSVGKRRIKRCVKKWAGL